MDYNKLRQKYIPNAPQTPADPVELPHADPIPVIEPPVAPEPEYAEPEITPPVRRPPAPLVPAKPRTPVRQDENDNEGIFGDDGGAGTWDPPKDKPRRQRRQWNFSLGNLAALPWVDIIMILLTVAGVVWVIVNFDAITVIIAAAIGKLVQSLISILLVVALIVGIVLLFSRGRWRRYL